MPLPTTFAGVSARGEGLFAAASGPVIGSIVYWSSTLATSANSFTTATWTCPAGVTSVSVVCVGPGSNNYASGNSYFSSSTIVQAIGGRSSGTPAGTYFAGGASYGYGGGGAGGYSSAGGAGATGVGRNGVSSTDGGGSGGSSSMQFQYGANFYTGGNGGGGGVGLYGPNVGYSSSGGLYPTGGTGGYYGGTGGGSGASAGGAGGGGSSSGSSGAYDQYSHGRPGEGGPSTNFAYIVTYYTGGNGGGGAFGGGAGGNGYGGYLAYKNNISVTPGNTYTVQVGLPTDNSASNGGGGGVRIVWPGATRQFPSTLVSTTTNETVNSI